MDESRAQLPDFKDPLDSLTEHFAPEQSRLLRIAGTGRISMQRFASAVSKGIDSSIVSVRYKLIAIRQFITEQISVLGQELEELRAHERSLQNALRNQQHGVKKITLYLAVYILVLIASFVLFSTTWLVIQPELPWWLGPAQAVVMVAPSILICQAYLRSPGKDRFLHVLHIIGIAAVLLTGIWVAVSKALFYTMMNSSTAGSFLTGTTSGSWIDTLQLVASGITFCALVITDAGLGGTLAILIYEAREAQRPVSSMKESLEETISKKGKLEAELQYLSKYLAAIENYDDIAEKFKAMTFETMLLECEAAQRRLAGAAHNRANGWYEELPYEDEYSLIDIERESEDDDD